MPSESAISVKSLRCEEEDSRAIVDCNTKTSFPRSREALLFQMCNERPAQLCGILHFIYQTFSLFVRTVLSALGWKVGRRFLSPILRCWQCLSLYCQVNCTSLNLNMIMTVFFSLLSFLTDSDFDSDRGNNCNVI